MDDAVREQGVQASPVVARALQWELVAFLAPLLEWLDARLDRRLVQTFVRGIVAPLEWRNRAHGLLLSELGAYVLDPAHAPAGTKRLSNLLRSPHGSASALVDYLWQQADRRLAELEASGAVAVLIWDSSGSPHACGGQFGGRLSRSGTVLLRGVMERRRGHRMRVELLALILVAIILLVVGRARPGLRRRGPVARPRVLRRWRPRTPEDCAHCRLAGTGEAAPSAPAVRPWRAGRSRRGAPRRISTQGHACRQAGCPY